MSEAKKSAGVRPCGLKTEVFSRVVGYHRPVTSWNKGKQEEFKERKVYKTAIPVEPVEPAAPVEKPKS